MFPKIFFVGILTILTFFILVFYTLISPNYVSWSRLRKAVIEHGFVTATYFDDHFIYEKKKDDTFSFGKKSFLFSYIYRTKDTEGAILTVPLVARYTVNSFSSPSIYFAGIAKNKIDVVLSKEKAILLSEKK